MAGVIRNRLGRICNLEGIKMENTYKASGEDPLLMTILFAYPSTADRVSVGKTSFTMELYI